jgi:hypothetical protein
MFKGARMKDPVRGQAQIVSCSMNRGDGVWQNCHLNLVVQGEGVPATSVEHNELIHRNKWPSPGMVLPITIDRSNPQKFKIEWDEVQDSRSRAAANADAMAAMMRGETPPGAGPMGAFGGANIQVINASGTDPRLLPRRRRRSCACSGSTSTSWLLSRGSDRRRRRRLRQPRTTRSTSSSSDWPS